MPVDCMVHRGIGAIRLLVGNRVGVGLTRSTVRHLLPTLFPVRGASNSVHEVVSPLWRGSGTTPMSSSWMENPNDKDRLLLKPQTSPPFPV